MCFSMVANAEVHDKLRFQTWRALAMTSNESSCWPMSQRSLPEAAADRHSLPISMLLPASSSQGLHSGLHCRCNQPQPQVTVTLNKHVCAFTQAASEDDSSASPTDESSASQIESPSDSSSEEEDNEVLLTEAQVCQLKLLQSSPVVG